MANKEVPVMDVSGKLGSIVDPVQYENGRKDGDANSWDDGEFIKVDRETFDGELVKSGEEGKTYVGESSWDKTKELEIELKRTVTVLKASESQNAQLKEEVLEGNGKKYKELEINYKNLQEKMTQTEKNFNEKLNARQHALEGFAGIKELYDNLTLDYDSSKMKIHELEGGLESKAAQFEDMVKSCQSKIEGADKRVGEVESLLEAKRKIIEELAGHLSTLESESKKYSGMVSELTEELKKCRSSILSLESSLKIATQKEDEAKLLSDKLKMLEDNLRGYECVLGEAEGRVEQSLSENELLSVTNSQLKNKIDELQTLLNFANSEKEDASLQLASHMNSITELTNQHSRSIELSHNETETNRLQAEGQVKVITNKLAGKEREVRELSERVAALESQVKRYQVEAGESAEIAEFRKLEVQEMLEKLVEQKDKVSELTNMLISLESQVKIYKEEKHQASELAESRKLEIDDMIAKLRHKEFEVKNLNEKIGSFEIQIKTLQDETSKVSGISESRRLEIEQLRSELSKVEACNEALAEANMKLTMDLAQGETKPSDIYAKKSRAGDEKDDLAAQYDLSKKIIEDLTEELRVEKQTRQQEVSKATVSGSNQLDEAKKELQAIINHLEEQLKGYKRNEDTQKAELENLKSEITEKSVFLKELEERYLTTEARLKDEVKSIELTATAREGDLTSQLEHHVLKLNERDLLDKKVMQLEQELQLSQGTVSKLVSESEAARRHASDNLEAKNTNISQLAKKVEELEQKLKEAEAVPELKEVETEVKSRDIGPMVFNLNPSSSSSIRARARRTEGSTSMNIKLILGAALVSIIIGAILGKRY